MCIFVARAVAIVLFVTVAFHVGADFIYYLCLGCLLSCVAISDLTTCRIPNSLILLIAAPTLFHAVLINEVGSSVAGGLCATLLFAAISATSRRLGAGDVKLALCVGLVTRWPEVFNALYWGTLAGAVVTATLLVCGVM